MSWTAWHLHLESASREVCDRVITEAVGPAVTGLPPRSWFFMRYWQGGPHVRLRIRDLEPARIDAIGADLATGLARVGRGLPTAQRLDRDGFAAQADRLARAGEGGSALVAQELVPPGVHLSRYEPEVDRYGGTAVLPVSEELFGTASRLCLAFLRTVPSPRARALLAVRATAAAAAVLGAPGTAPHRAFASYGVASWRDWAQRFGIDEPALVQLDAESAVVAERLTSSGRDLAGPAEGNPVHDWTRELAAAVPLWRSAADRAAPRVLFSHVHMLHNRLGLSALEELRSYAVLAHHSASTERGGASHLSDITESLAVRTS